MSNRVERLSGVRAFFVALAIAASGGLAWIRGCQPVDDRGSDSTEKSFMMIFAITVGGLVLGAGTLYVTRKIGLWGQ